MGGLVLRVNTQNSLPEIQNSSNTQFSEFQTSYLLFGKKLLEGPDRKTSIPRKRVQEVGMGAERAGGMPRGWPGTESPGQPAPGETQAGDDVEIARDTFDVLGFRLLVKALGWNSYSVLRQCSR